MKNMGSRGALFANDSNKGSKCLRSSLVDFNSVRISRDYRSANIDKPTR